MNTKIATSVRYGNYKKYLDRTRKFESIINDLKDEILSKFYITEDDFYITFRPIKGNVHGRAFPNGDIELDVRFKTFRSGFNTFIHELTHIDQYKLGRLVDGNFINSNKYTVYFDDKKYFCFENRSSKNSFKTYYDSPWEVEARVKADILTKSIYDARFKKQ